MWASAIESGETPAFGYMYDFRLPTHYRSGALEPLMQYFNQEELDRLLQEPLQTAMFKDDFMPIPMLVTSDHLVYNKDIFAAAGIEVPDNPYYSPSWEEFLDWSQKIKAEAMVNLIMACATSGITPLMTSICALAVARQTRSTRR